jgi:hypothetical protein
MKRCIEVHPTFPAMVPELKNVVQEEWGWLHLAERNKYIDLMPERIMSLHRCKGVQIPY